MKTDYRIRKQKNHKNVLVLLICLITCLFVPMSIHAEESEEGYMNCDTTEELMELYLRNHNVSERTQLRPENSNELSDLLQEYKNIHFEIDRTQVARAKLSRYTGGIFLHFDSQTSSWNHGHAGIGSGSGVIEILGPSYTVTKYGEARVKQWYNAKTGGFYTVRGASSANNTEAANHAYDKIGIGYWLIGSGGFGGYTCSGLVAVSWGETGFDLGGRTATPSSLEANSKTILQFKWADSTY